MGPNSGMSSGTICSLCGDMDQHVHAGRAATGIVATSWSLAGYWALYLFCLWNSQKYVEKLQSK